MLLLFCTSDGKFCSFHLFFFFFFLFVSPFIFLFNKSQKEGKKQPGLDTSFPHTGTF